MSTSGQPSPWDIFEPQPLCRGCRQSFVETDETVMKYANSSTQTSVAKPKDLVHLFDLPQEIQDEIFVYAHPRMEGKFSISSRHCWECAQMKRICSDATYQPQPFVPKVNEFLVSKRFFISAVRVYVGNQKLENLPIGGILQAFATNMRVQASMVICQITVPKLQAVEIEITPDDVGSTPVYLAMTAVMNDEELKDCSLFQAAAVAWSGLSSLKLKASKFEIRDDTRMDIWESNVRNLEALLLQVTTKPKKISKDVKEKAHEYELLRRPLRLYEGSRVSFDRSKSAVELGWSVPSWYAYDSPTLREALAESSHGEEAHDDDNTADNEDEVDPAAEDIELADLVLDRAAADLNPPQIKAEDIPDTDQEIVRLFLTNSVGMLAYIREGKDRENKRAQQKEQMVSMSDILGKLGLD